MFVLLYFAISFVSAFLLFSVQPIAAKAVLPVLGGAPFVWNGCMLFFQSILLGGYLYAHKITGRYDVRKQVVIHIAVLYVALLLFPSSFTNSELVNAARFPLLWLMTTLATSVALPFFALSATAPTIQAWFVSLNHKRSDNPYFLYAASNLGSFGSLLCYVVLIEPNYTRAEQMGLMRWGYAVLVLLFSAAGYNLFQAYKARPVSKRSETSSHKPISRAQIMYWLVLSFVPSSLLYGVTQYITTDVASMPLLWVMPLALYLLTFVLVFADKPRGVVVSRFLHVPLATGMVLIYLWGLKYDMWLMFLHIVVFFIVTMSCHATLSEARPQASQLTNFYLWVSLGGVLGGIFNIMIAPLIFTSITEYPLMLGASIILSVPLAAIRECKWDGKTLLPAILTMLAAFGFYVVIKHIGDIAEFVDRKYGDVEDGLWDVIAEWWRMMIVVMMCYGAYRYRMMMTMVSLALMVGANMMVAPYNKDNYLFNERNIFGVNRVFYRSWNNANYFRHGTTDHGKQSLDEEYRLNPISYYVPLKMVFDVIGKDKRTAEQPIGLMGLGVGTIACYGKKDQRIDVFEIDPLVKKIAVDDSLFTYMRDCPPEKNIEIGDGRISLSKKEDKSYGIIIADAFTSDAVPVHLITMEAVSMYLDKVVDGGVVAIHITNRHLGLKPVVSAIAHELGAHAYHFAYYPSDDEPLADSCEWIMVTRDPSLFGRLQKVNEDWTELTDNDPEYLWRDDFSNILKVMYFDTDLWGLFEE